jgi:two-component system, sensor histidine kinase and response regulator
MRSVYFSSIAHELKTPLNSIIPMLKLLSSHISNLVDSKAKSYMNVIMAGTYHLQSVIEDALDMSRLESNKFLISKEMLDIRQLIDSFSDLVSLQVSQKGLKLITEFDPNVPTKVLIDPKRYKQVLFNLVNNAIKFTY